jgi:hypothetical protein
VTELAVVMFGTVLLLAGCTEGSTPDTTVPPVVVIGTTVPPSPPIPTSSTPTSTSEAPLDPTNCSAADLNLQVEDYPRAYDGLTAPAAATRKAIIDAALACDFDGLTALAVPLIEQGPGGKSVPLIFSGVTRDIDEFVAYDQRHSALRKLVLALSSVPVALVESETADRVPVVFYIWPPFWDDDTASNRSSDQVWDDDTIERVAILNGIPSETLVTVINDASPVYPLFTVAILEDGRWMGAFAGT